MKSINQKISKLFYWNKNKAFTMLYDLYFEQLIAISIAITRNNITSEDIIQNIFIKIYEEERYKYIKNYEHYLTLAVRNASINLLQRSPNNTGTECLVNLTTDAIEEDERLQKVLYHISKLPTSSADIFKKVVFDEWSYEAVAFDKELSVNTIKTHMRKAYNFLRKNVTIFLIFITLTYFSCVLLENRHNGQIKIDRTTYKESEWSIDRS